MAFRGVKTKHTVTFLQIVIDVSRSDQDTIGREHHVKRGTNWMHEKGLQKYTFKTKKITLSPLKCFQFSLSHSRNRPIRTRYLGHVTSYQPIRDQYFLIRGKIVLDVESFPNFFRLLSLYHSDPKLVTSSGERVLVTKSGWPLNRVLTFGRGTGSSSSSSIARSSSIVLIVPEKSKQPIRTRYLDHVTGY
eukprot:sb/3471166/